MKRIMRAIRYFLNYKNYFHFQKNYLFEKKLTLADKPIRTAWGEDVTLTIVSDPLQIDRLIVEGYNLHSFPFFKGIMAGLKKGSVFFFISIGREPVHASMVALESASAISDPSFEKIDDKDAGYIGPCYTLPQYRGKKIYPFVLYKICEFLKTKGKSKALIQTKKSNTASRKGITKAGFIRIGEIDCLRLLFRNFYKIKLCNERGGGG